LLCLSNLALLCRSPTQAAPRAKTSCRPTKAAFAQEEHTSSDLARGLPRLQEGCEHAVEQSLLECRLASPTAATSGSSSLHPSGGEVAVNTPCSKTLCTGGVGPRGSDAQPALPAVPSSQTLLEEAWPTLVPPVPPSLEVVGEGTWRCPSLCSSSSGRPGSDGLCEGGEYDVQDYDPIFAKQGLHPCFGKEEVEFYCVSRRCWLAAQVRATVRNVVGVDGSDLIQYTVHFQDSGEVVQDVPLDTIRRPIEDQEEVEVFSLSALRWRPGVVVSTPASCPTKYGYTVQLYDVHGELEEPCKVQASLIRRHFGPGACVEVYMGAAQGWKWACVAEDGNHVDVGGWEQPLLLAPLSKYHSPDSRVGEQDPAKVPTLWVALVVCCESQRQTVFRVPSYRVRWLTSV